MTPSGYPEITVEGKGRGERVIDRVFCVSLNLAKEAEGELLHDPGSGELSRYVREQRLAPQCLPQSPPAILPTRVSKLLLLWIQPYLSAANC